MIDSPTLAAIADAHGTPLYVYDLDEVEQRARTLRAALPARVELAYAVKANPSLAVLARLAGAGLGADVSSGGELAAAVRAGFPEGSIGFTGPGKRDEELATAAARPLRAIVVESPGELERLRHLLRGAGRRSPVLLRAAGEARDGNVIGSGRGRFGMRWPDVVATARTAAEAPELELIGLHRFDASNVRDADELLAHARRTVALAARLAEEAGTAFSLLDLGGGLGIAYRDDEPPLDLPRLCAGLEGVLRGVDADPRLAGARLLLEPGRWIVGLTGTYVVRVLDVKDGDDVPVVTTDGGVHHLLRPALVGEPHRIRSLAHDAGARPLRHVVVGGPLCTSLDVLGETDLPEPVAGDLLAVLDAGAYGFSESMPYFLSHPIPAEVGVTGGSAFVARARVEPDELLMGQAIGPTLTREALAT